MKEEKIKPKADFVFEVSWEVCNKIGGIYRVIESKAKRMVDYYGENYYLVGPYFPEKAKGEFQEFPLKELLPIFSKLEKEGIVCYGGKWLVGGEPKVILIDFQKLWPAKNEIKKAFWENFGIDSLRAGFDFEEPLLWGVAVGRLLEEFRNIFKNEKIVLHFHEWLSASSLLYLKKRRVKIKSVFTTHSTVLGRSLAANQIPFYSFLEKILPEREIYHYYIEAKSQLEKKAAQECDLFTTVSEITSLEASYFLERKADLILQNGLDFEKIPPFDELALKQKIQRARIREFASFYFLPYYSLDLQNTLFYFTASRYEFHNKGIDILIQALGLLNKRLKEKKNKKNIIVFFWIPAQSKEKDPEIVENKERYQDIKDFLEEFSQSIRENILHCVIGEGPFSKEKIFSKSKSFLRELQKKKLSFKREKASPPLCTHKLFSQQDPILLAFKKEGLENKKEDKVKVIFYPAYLTGADGLLNLNFQEAVEGSDLGIFPSFYESWGYTVLETASLGVCAVTTDLAGIGRFFKKKISRAEKYPGIFILERFKKEEKEIVENLAQILEDFYLLSKNERVENKISARKKAQLCDWKLLVKKYIQAHNLALEKK